MAKETVIVFDGEDKFVSKRNRKYNAVKGVSKYVSADGDVSTDTTTSTTTLAPVVNLGLPMPTPDGSASYCDALRVYIETRGNNLATAPQIMEAHQYFLTHCNEANQTTSTTTSSTTLPPISTSSPTTTTTLPVISGNVVVNTPIIPPKLGQRPQSSKDGEGAGEEKKEKSKNLWWLLLIGVGILYVFSKDNKN